MYGSDDCAKPSSATPSCAETFNKGTVITLDDSTTGSTKFVGWESLPPVASCFGPGICTFTLTADTTVTGVFEPPQVLTTTVVGDGQGSVETSDYSLLLHRGLRCEKALNQNSKSCTISYSYGTEETLTAVPAARLEVRRLVGRVRRHGDLHGADGPGAGRDRELLQRRRDPRQCDRGHPGDPDDRAADTHLVAGHGGVVHGRAAQLARRRGDKGQVRPGSRDRGSRVRQHRASARRRAGPDHAPVCVPGRADAGPGSDHCRSGPVGDRRSRSARLAR